MILIIGVVLASVSFASAVSTHASGVTTIKDTKIHYALIFNIPYNSFKSSGTYIVGGVDTNPAVLSLLYPHSNPQKWTRQSYDSGKKSILLIPERYTWIHPKYAKEIYVYTSGGGGGSW